MSREASSDALEHQRSLSVLAAVQAYWGYVAATRRLEVLRDAEDRAQRLLDETRKLIQADERPAADEVRVRANYTSKRASRVAAEGGLTQSRAALASAMGVAQSFLLALPSPTTPLPDLREGSSFPDESAASQLALARRKDLVVAKHEFGATAALLAGARSESRPRFDMSFGVDYRGAAAGSPLNAVSAAHGLRTTVGFGFGVPLQNRDFYSRRASSSRRSRNSSSLAGSRSTPPPRRADSRPLRRS
jgi:outer membrane protein TolC